MALDELEPTADGTTSTVPAIAAPNWG